jgi:hypothetical protein
MDQNLTPTPADQWVTATALEGYDLQLPSGNVARVRRLTPTALLTNGLIPDPLTSLIRKAIHTNKGLNPKQLEEIAEDPDRLAAAMLMFDQVLVHVMVMPKVVMPPTCAVAVPDGICGLYANEPVHKNPTRTGKHAYVEGERHPGVLYADVVEMEDKMFVFQWCLGGTADLNQFRAEQASSVESVPGSQDLEDTA